MSKNSYGSFSPRFGSSCMWTFYETRPQCLRMRARTGLFSFVFFLGRKKKGRKCMSCRRGEGKETILVVVLHCASSSGSGICVWDVAPKIERENPDDGDQDDDSVIVTISPPVLHRTPPSIDRRRPILSSPLPPSSSTSSSSAFGTQIPPFPSSSDYSSPPPSPP